MKATSPMPSKRSSLRASERALHISRFMLHACLVLLVAITGWGQDADRLRSREAGFDLHLVKPVDAQDLAQALSDRNGATLH